MLKVMRTAATLAVAGTFCGGAVASADGGGGAGHAAAGERSLQRAPLTAKPRAGAVDVQLLTVSDWHGQLEPTTPAGGVPTGGAPALKAYFDAARQANPNTLTFMAGDSVGATPPVSSFFDDEPAIRAMNMLGVDADTLGNHNFDAGVARLQRHVDLADFPFLSANLPGLDEDVSGVAKRRLFDLDGVRVAVIGITNEEAPTLVAPGALGSARVTDGVAAADKAAAQARKAGADAVVILTHKGIRGVDPSGAAFGELVDFAAAVDEDLIDVVAGDHTDFAYAGTHDGVLAVENKSKGVTFAKISLTVDRERGVVSRGSTFVTPKVADVIPDPALQAYIDGLKEQLRPILGTVLGDATRAIPRADSCGQSAGRVCESLVGNVVTDALRTTYGTDLAITNSGGLRADLTCPSAGASAFCPASWPTPFPITRGGTLGVLPFGNISATGTLTGTEVKAFLEHSVRAIPGASGQFAQVSGLCFTYEVTAPAGSRVSQVVRQAADGTCTGPVIPADGTVHTVTTNDFTAAGGDGYPNVLARFTTRNLMEDDLAAYIRTVGTVAPALQDRIRCTDANGAAAPNCPVRQG